MSYTKKINGNVKPSALLQRKKTRIPKATVRGSSCPRHNINVRTHSLSNSKGTRAPTSHFIYLILYQFIHCSKTVSGKFDATAGWSWLQIGQRSWSWSKIIEMSHSIRLSTSQSTSSVFEQRGALNHRYVMYLCDAHSALHSEAPAHRCRNHALFYFLYHDTEQLHTVKYSSQRFNRRTCQI